MAFDLLALLHDGPFVVAHKGPKRGKSSGWKDVRVASADEAHRLLQDANRGKRSAFVRIAEFGPADNAHGGPLVELANIRGCRAFLLDIDADGGDGYPDLPPAFDAMLDAIEAVGRLGVPTPNAIVLSGHGYHVAWVLDALLPLDLWQRYRDALYGLLHSAGLRFDPGGGNAHLAIRYAVPGLDLYNYKDPAHPAKVGVIHGDGRRIPAQLFRRALDPHLVTYGPTRSRAKVSVAVDNTVEQEFGELPDGRPFRLDEVVPHCAQLHAAYEARGRDARYPFWLALLQMARRHADPDQGLAWAHTFSSGHPGYDPNEVEGKWGSFRPDGGIIKCATLRKHSPCPSRCDRCPFWADAKGPGEGSPAKIPGELARRQFAAMRLPHKDYQNTPRGVERTVRDKDGQVEQIVIFRGYNILDVELQEPKDQDATARGDAVAQLAFKLRVVSGAWERAMTISAIEAAETRGLARAMGRQDMLLVGEELGQTQKAFRAWMQTLREQRQIRHTYHRLGWSNDRREFVLGDRVYGADGSERAIATGLERAGYAARGDAAEWQRIAALIMRHETRPEAHALVATSFAAPLVCLTGVPGALINCHSKRSGMGKTVLAKLSASAWGNWSVFHQTVDDTTAALQRKLAIQHHLCSYFDEARPSNRRDFFNMLSFRIGQGQEKKRLSSDIKPQEAGSWATLVVTCTNFALAGILGGKNAADDAAPARVLDMEMPPLCLPPGTSLSEVQQEIAKLSEHHGWVGRAYADYIVRHRAGIEQYLRQYTDILLEQFRVHPYDNAGRIQAAAGACLIVGADIVRQLGLVPGLDPGLVIQAVKRALVRASGVRRELQARLSCDDVLRDFLKENQPQSQMTVREAIKLKPGVPGPVTYSNKKMPHPSQREFRPKLPLFYEIDCHAQEIAVDARVFEEWAQTRGLDPYELRQEIHHRYGKDERVLAQGVQTGGKVQVLVLPAKPGAAFHDFLPPP